MTILAQLHSLRFNEVMLTYIIITLFYLALVSLVALVVTNTGRRLVLLGLITLVASIGYGIVSVPVGSAFAPTMTKLGALMAFGGVVSWLLPANGGASTAQSTGLKSGNESRPEALSSSSPETEG